MLQFSIQKRFGIKVCVLFCELLNVYLSQMEGKLEKLLRIRCKHFDHISNVLLNSFRVFNYLRLRIFPKILNNLSILYHNFRHRQVVPLLMPREHILVQLITQLLQLTHIDLVFLLLNNSLHFLDVLLEFVKLLLAIPNKLVVCEES